MEYRQIARTISVVTREFVCLSSGSCVASGYSDCCEVGFCGGYPANCFCDANCYGRGDCCDDITTTCTTGQFNTPTTVLFNPPTTVLFNPPTTALFNPPTTVLFNPPTTALFNPPTTALFNPPTTALFNPPIPTALFKELEIPTYYDCVLNDRTRLMY